MVVTIAVTRPSGKETPVPREVGDRCGCDDCVVGVRTGTTHRQIKGPDLDGRNSGQQKGQPRIGA